MGKEDYPNFWFLGLSNRGKGSGRGGGCITTLVPSG
jgi:hypothetical protein